MIAAEKIYYAKEKWNCSFEELAYLLDLEWTVVRNLYQEEMIKRLPKITIDGDLNSLNMLSTHTRNALHRSGIRTIKDLITYEGNFAAIYYCGKQSLDEIAEAKRAIATVLNLNVPSLIAAWASGGTNVEVNWVDSKPNYGKTVTKWTVTRTKTEKVESITGRTKGWLKTIYLDVWLNS